MSTPVLAKPSGILLVDHTRHLHEQADEYFALRPYPVAKYKERTGEDLRALVRSAIDWHDTGKQHHKWQKACQLDHAEYKDKGKTSGKNLQKTKIRHEMHSLFLAEQNKRTLAETVRVAIAAHHAKLSYKAEERWQTDDDSKYHSLWCGFTRLKGTVDYGEFDIAIRERYRFGGVRALLQLFDHRASAKEAKDDLPPFDTFHYDFPYKAKDAEGNVVLDGHGNPVLSLRGVQSIVAELYDEPVGILRAPTGSGKTDAALLWAKHQIENGRADRLVIAMPTRFTASALAIATSDTLGSSGVYHSSAWVQRNDKSKLAKKEHELARLLETPITVTTVDHLCICLTGRREDHHAIFWGLAHSCVVIDESDFYDAFTQANLVVLLRALRLLGVPVLIMSATVPDSFRELYARSGYAIKSISEDKDKATVPRCNVVRHDSLVEKPEDIADLLSQGEDGKPLIIYANTVARAQAYFDYWQEKGFESVVLYHSRFTETDKKRIEGELLDMLGKEAWASETSRGIAILTQIGELSINISADRMISDLAPLDRLVQRIGRLSRFGENVGEITIIEPAKKEEPYPAPYGTYRTGSGWIASDALVQTGTLFTEGEYTREDLVVLVDRLYPEVAEDSERVKINRRKLEENSIGNWLIVPMRQMTEDADEDEEWSCRDIGPQRTVYAQWEIGISGENASFPTWGSFNEYAQSRAINIPIYEFNKALENGWIEKESIGVGDDTEDIYRVIDQFYDTRRGVSFPASEES